MFKLIYKCSYCHETWETIFNGGKYELASICKHCGEGAPLVGVEECTITSLSRHCKKETS